MSPCLPSLPPSPSGPSRGKPFEGRKQKEAALCHLPAHSSSLAQTGGGKPALCHLACLPSSPPSLLLLPSLPSLPSLPPVLTYISTWTPAFRSRRKSRFRLWQFSPLVALNSTCCACCAAGGGGGGGWCCDNGGERVL